MHKMAKFFAFRRLFSAQSRKKCGQFLLCFLAMFCVLTLFFRFVPIPFSAYMAQQKIGHWLDNQAYSIQYQWVSLENISTEMQLAVIAAEDQRFPQHYGIDWKAIEMAFKHNQKSNRTRGGSTISQQTVKNLYLWHGQSWLRKSIELPMTLAVEMLWSKQRILEVYLNIAEFGEGIFGVEAASRHYFNKSAKQLNLKEAALLAAVLPNPIIYKAHSPSRYLYKKQVWIMKQMNQLGQSYLNHL